MRLYNYGNLLYVFMLVGVGAVAADVEPGAPVGPSKYNGPGSCSSTSCHGGVQPRAQTTVLQNEYSTWTVQDKHARAFSALTGDIGKRMGRILHLETETSARCVTCHALDITPAQKASTFD